MKAARPFPREIFRLPERRAEPYFYTSSAEKFLQARLVCARFGLHVRLFRSRTDPYEEDYSLGRERLLESAVDQVRRTVASGVMFFVEDTSLRLEGLSAEADFPGLAVKEWFRETGFAELDSALRDRGNDRRATVRSDIALYVPGLGRIVRFTGETQGRVAPTPPQFEPSPQYPWLTPATFNGWFIPEGTAKRLGQMSIEESWHYDFRVRALSHLVERLEEYSAALNLPPSAYRLRRRTGTDGQIQLFEGSRKPQFIVIGRTCAGKTTFGDRAAEHDVEVIEASSVVRSFVSPGAENATPFENAERLLAARGPAVVAERILELYADELEHGFVITGFRTVEEVDRIKQAFPDTQVVLIDAPERLRFERYLTRATRDEVADLDALRELDAQQEGFGLLRLAELFADLTIENEGTLDDYLGQVDAAVAARPGQAPGVSTSAGWAQLTDGGRLYRWLRALAEADRPLTAREIAEVTSGIGAGLRNSNINYVLRSAAELVRRVEHENEPARFELLPAGRQYVDRVSARLQESEQMKSQ